MFIAREKLETNVVEYLLYMFHIEEVIRINKFSMNELEKSIISRYHLPAEQLEEVRNWYRGLIVCEETLTLVLDMSWVLCGIEGRHEEGPLEWYERGLRMIGADPDRVTGRGSQC